MRIDRTRSRNLFGRISQRKRVSEVARLPEIKVDRLESDVVELFKKQQEVNKSVLDSIKYLETTVREIMALLTPDDSTE